MSEKVYNDSNLIEIDNFNGSDPVNRNHQINCVHDLERKSTKNFHQHSNKTSCTGPNPGGDLPLAARRFRPETLEIPDSVLMISDRLLHLFKRPADPFHVPVRLDDHVPRCLLFLHDACCHSCG